MLITLEGIDGGGKTTVAAGLETELSERTVFTREPTGSWYGEAVERSIGDEDADPMAELFLYTADHADHLSRVVRPALGAGADAYVTADVKYHEFFNVLGTDGAPEMAIVDPGHYESEALTEALLRDWLGTRFPAVDWTRTDRRTSPMKTFVPSAD